jgi:hypothetical protein
MPQSTHKVVHPESIYDVIELIGTSTKSGKMLPRMRSRRQENISASYA